MAEIGIQVDLPPKTPSKNVIQEGEENVSKLKSQLAELQNKQKRFAKLFEEAPTTKSKFKL